MPIVLEETSCSIGNLAIDVLFVGNRQLSPELSERLDESGFVWQTLAVSRFVQHAQTDCLGGMVVIDGESIQPDQMGTFEKIIETLNTKSVPVLFFNADPKLRLDHLHLTFQTSSLEFEELWAWIESSVRFSRHLQHLVKNNSLVHSADRVSSETAQQLEMAARVQRNFLPALLPHTENIRWAAVYRPAEWVSGDIYDIARLDEEHIGFYLTDAVGHSVPAALLTMFLKQATVMRQTFGDRYFIYKPADVIRNLNLRMAEQELNGCLFATCVYGLLNIRTLQLDYARAGHPYPILIRNNQLTSLQTRGGLLGVFESAEFEQHTLQLQPGDKLFVYSDGGEPLIGQNKEDGTLQYFESFRRLCRLPIDEMLKAYAQMAADFRFARSQIDDVSAIGLEIV